MIPASTLSSLTEEDREALLSRAVSVARSRSSTEMQRISRSSSNLQRPSSTSTTTTSSSSSSLLRPSSPLSTTASLLSSLLSTSSSPSSSISLPISHPLQSLPCSSCGRLSTITCGKCYLYNYCGIDCLQIAWQGYVKCANWSTNTWCACTYCFGKSSGRSISTDSDRLRRCHREVCRRLIQGVPASIRAKAGLGEPHSLAMIGDYFRTRDDDPDFVKAAEFYKRAALKGDAKAMFYLGLFHKNGTGVKVDTQLTINYWTRSAGKGANGLAQYHLGLAYLHGDILPTNLNEARRWLTLALMTESVDKETINSALTLCKAKLKE